MIAYALPISEQFQIYIILLVFSIILYTPLILLGVLDLSQLCSYFTVSLSGKLVPFQAQVASSQL